MKNLEKMEAKMSEENGMNEMQQTQISDIIEDFIPAESTPAAEVPVEETPVVSAGQEEVPITPKEEVPNVEEGQERKAEEAGRQEQTDEPTEKVKEGVTPVPVVETPAKPVESVKEPTELEKVLEENKALKTYIEEMAAKVVSPQSKQLTPEEQAAQQAERENASKQVLQFIKDDNMFDELMSKPDNFNALLTSVVNVSVERALRLMPQIATTLVEQQMEVKDSIRDFYIDNKDLEPHKKYVGFVANEIAAQHPDYSLKQLLQEVEKEVRGKLRITRSAQPAQPIQRESQQIGNPRTAQENPGFVPTDGRGGRRGSASSDGNLSPQEKDILGLIS